MTEVIVQEMDNKFFFFKGQHFIIIVFLLHALHDNWFTVVVCTYRQTAFSGPLQVVLENTQKKTSHAAYGKLFANMDNNHNSLCRARKYIYMLFTRREVRIGKNCAQGLGYRPRAVNKTEDTVFPNTDRPWLVNNIFIFF